MTNVSIGSSGFFGLICFTKWILPKKDREGGERKENKQKRNGRKHSRSIKVSILEWPWLGLGVLEPTIVIWQYLTRVNNEQLMWVGLICVFHWHTDHLSAAIRAAFERRKENGIWWTEEKNSYWKKMCIMFSRFLNHIKTLFLCFLWRASSAYIFMTDRKLHLKEILSKRPWANLMLFYSSQYTSFKTESRLLERIIDFEYWTLNQ